MNKEESIIGKLYQTAGMPNNMVIPTHIMTTAATKYQAHLERISNFLAEGEGVWWKTDPKRVEFFDGAESSTTVPGVMHFRSNTLESVALYLQMKWEQCISFETPVPAVEIRTYHSNGDLNQFTLLNRECNNRDEWENPTVSEREEPTEQQGKPTVSEREEPTEQQGNPTVSEREEPTEQQGNSTVSEREEPT